MRPEPSGRRYLARVKVGPCQHVLQVQVPLVVLLAQQVHGLRLPQHRPRGAHLAHLNELQHNLAASANWLTEAVDG